MPGDLQWDKPGYLENVPDANGRKSWGIAVVNYELFCKDIAEEIDRYWELYDQVKVLCGRLYWSGMIFIWNLKEIIYYFIPYKKGSARLHGSIAWGSYPAAGDHYIQFGQNEDDDVTAIVYYQQEIYDEEIDLSNLGLYMKKNIGYRIDKGDIYDDDRIRKMLLLEGLAKMIMEVCDLLILSMRTHPVDVWAAGGGGCSDNEGYLDSDHLGSLGDHLEDRHHAGHDGLELYRDEGDHGEDIKEVP